MANLMRLYVSMGKEESGKTKNFGDNVTLTEGHYKTTRALNIANADKEKLSNNHFKILHILWIYIY